VQYERKARPKGNARIVIGHFAALLLVIGIIVGLRMPASPNLHSSRLPRRPIASGSPPLLNDITEKALPFGEGWVGSTKKASRNREAFVWINHLPKG